MLVTVDSQELLHLAVLKERLQRPVGPGLVAGVREPILVCREQPDQSDDPVGGRRIDSEVRKCAGNQLAQTPFIHPASAPLRNVRSSGDLAKRMNEEPAEQAGPALWVITQLGFDEVRDRLHVGLALWCAPLRWRQAALEDG